MRRCNVPFQNYDDRLSKLNLKSLQYRRITFDLILMYRIVYGLSDLDFENYFNFKDHSYNLRGNSMQVHSKFRFKTNHMNSCFFVRIVKYWNFLPNEAVVASSLVLFNKQLLNVNLDHMLIL